DEAARGDGRAQARILLRARGEALHRVPDPFRAVVSVVEGLDAAEERAVHRAGVPLQEREAPLRAEAPRAQHDLAVAEGQAQVLEIVRDVEDVVTGQVDAAPRPLRLSRLHGLPERGPLRRVVA